MSNSIADDLLEGARAIALELYGKDDRATLRRVNYLIEAGHIPTGKLGAKRIASKAQLRAMISAQVAA
jgi:hypothetical protein